MVPAADHDGVGDLHGPTITREVIDPAAGGGEAGRRGHPIGAGAGDGPEFLRRVAAGDPERIGQLFADEVDWKLDWPDGDYTQTVPWIRHRSTRADAADNFREIAEHHAVAQAFDVV